MGAGPPSQFSIVPVQARCPATASSQSAGRSQVAARCSKSGWRHANEGVEAHDGVEGFGWKGDRGGVSADKRPGRDEPARSLDLDFADVDTSYLMPRSGPAASRALRLPG